MEFHSPDCSMTPWAQQSVFDESSHVRSWVAQGQGWTDAMDYRWTFAV